MPSRRLQALSAIAAVALLGTALLVTASMPSSSEPTLANASYPVPEGAVFAAPNGHDSAAGTRADPLRTVAAAVHTAQPGGTVVLRDGVYRESLGMVRKRLTLQPYPGEQVWLKGSAVVGDWAEADGRWVHDGWQDELCNDCFLPEIIDPEYPLAGRPQMAFLDGRPLRQVDTRAQVRAGTFYVGDGNVVIGDDPAGRRVEVTEHDRLLQFDGESAEGSALRGVGVAHYGSNQNYGARGAMVVVNAPDVLIEDVTFTHSASTALSVFQPDARVLRSEFVGNGLVGLHANRADGLRVSASTFTGNNAEHFAVSGPAVGAAGMKVTRTAQVSVAKNVFAENHATGWWCDLGCTDAVVTGNEARDNSGHGMHYEVSSGARVEGNTFTDNGGHGLKLSSADRVNVHGNTFTDNGRPSLGLYNDPRPVSFDPYSEQLGLTWLTAELNVTRNAFEQHAGDLPVIDSADYRPETQGNPPFIAAADHNCYLRPSDATGPLAVLVTGDGEAETFPSLRDLRAAGFGEHSRSGTPGDDPAGCGPS